MVLQRWNDKKVASCIRAKAKQEWVKSIIVIKNVHLPKTNFGQISFKATIIGFRV
jgi:hypothetical protein